MNTSFAQFTDKQLHTEHKDILLNLGWQTSQRDSCQKGSPAWNHYNVEKEKSERILSALMEEFSKRNLIF